MGNKIGRNDPCWCGSGTKFKKCHLLRGEMLPPTIQEVTSELRKVANKRVCLHPNASSSVCKGGIVRAHTIQKSGGLSRIAQKGHVYSFMGNDITNPKSMTASLTPRLIGIKLASTFTGFCEYHDGTTFEPIEKHHFQASQEHAFLLAYRVLCRELYGKRMQNEMVPFHRSLDRGQDELAQINHQFQVSEYAGGVNAGLRDSENCKSNYDAALLSKDYSSVKYYVIRFDKTPDILCSAGHFPSCDFAGNQLQDLSDVGKQLDHITFSLIPTDTGGAAIFSWIGNSVAAEKLLKSLHSQSDDQIPHSIVRYIFEFFENAYYAPSWWESLDEEAKKKLQRRFNTAINLFLKRQSSCLLDDGIRAVTWSITCRETNINFS